MKIWYFRMYVLVVIIIYYYINLMMVLFCKIMIYMVINYFIKKCVCLFFLVRFLINIKVLLIDFKLLIFRIIIDFEIWG